MNKQVLRRGLKTPDLELRDLSSAFTSYIVQWRNAPAARKWFKTDALITAESHEAWLAKASKSETDFNWVIISNDLGPVGAAGLYDVDWEARTAEFGRLVIGAAALGRGFGAMALTSILTLASEAGLAHVHLEVKPDNSRAIAIYERTGFRALSVGEMLIMGRSISAPIS